MKFEVRCDMITRKKKQYVCKMRSSIPRNENKMMMWKREEKCLER